MVALVAILSTVLACAALVSLCMLYRRLDTLRKLHRNLQARHALAAMDRAAIMKDDLEDVDMDVDPDL